MTTLLALLPAWFKLPRTCWEQGCRRLVWDEPWEMKWVVPLCMEHRASSRFTFKARRRTEMNGDGAQSIAARLVDDLHALEVALKHLEVDEDPGIVEIVESLRENIKFYV